MVVETYLLVVLWMVVEIVFWRKIQNRFKYPRIKGVQPYNGYMPKLWKKLESIIKLRPIEDRSCGRSFGI